jgi:hypothetical protein
MHEYRGTLTGVPPKLRPLCAPAPAQASFNRLTRLPPCLLHLPRLELLRVAVCAIRELPERLLEV